MRMLARRAARSAAGRRLRGLCTSSGHTLEATSPGFYTLTLDRPAVHNAFNDHMIRALSETLDTLHATPGLRGVFVSGGSSKSFCAGADLEWMKRAATYTAEQNTADALSLSGMLHKLSTLPCPSVALVHGNAFGGGVGLVAACDIAVGTADARFALSEARLGLIPATISPYVLRRIGHSHATRYFLTGERFDAARAQHIGLLHELADDAAGLAGWRERLEAELRLCAPSAAAASKGLIAAVAGRPIDDALMAETARRLSEQRASADATEGVGAFLARRKPAWTEGGGA